MSWVARMVNRLYERLLPVLPRLGGTVIVVRLLS
jgi:hypothetical protein